MSISIIIKSIQDIMRQDAGVDGDAQQRDFPSTLPAAMGAAQAGNIAIIAGLSLKSMITRDTNFYLNEGDSSTLSKWVKAHSTPQQIVLRSKIILSFGQRLKSIQIAKELSVSHHTCRLWRNKFIEYGPKILWEISSGRGRKPNSKKAKK